MKKMNIISLLFILVNLTLVLICLSSKAQNGIDTTLLVVILSESSNYHDNLVRSLIQDVNIQMDQLNSNISVVFYPANEVTDPGSWTYFPFFYTLDYKYPDGYTWVLFVDTRTKINFTNLVDVLNSYDPEEKIWVGHGLYDKEPTIIHHFLTFDKPEQFKYPNIASGFLMSYPLVQRVREMIVSGKYKIPDFSIDASHELAKLVGENTETVEFKNDESFCIKESVGCGTYVIPFKPCNNDLLDSVLFAVTTCGLYHQNRIQVIKNTWGKYAKNILYFSDELDESIPTIQLNSTNVTKGFCEKTKKVLEFLSENLHKYPDVKWIASIDDDTILSISHLHEFLTCFDPTDQTLIGQRYGYNMFKSPLKEHLNYATGGAGVILSKGVLNSLVDKKVCNCTSPEDPEDMFIFGVCLSRVNVNIIHSSGFHQSRPSDYAEGYLESDHLITFHKHWMIDPVKVYTDFFAKDDLFWYQRNNNKSLKLKMAKDEF